MNNEPVAWMNSKGDIILPAHQANKEYNIPLYTHPVKELTNDELFKVYVGLQEGYSGNNFPVDLGRAILRKAQEK